jgi:predicted nuclease of predicted toxin-antitoxin system
MKRLFVELYLDEDVSVLVAELLRSHGFDVLPAREAGQLGKSDEEQLAYALSQSRALVSHNRSDFEALAQQYFEAERTHYGIILAVRRSPYEVMRRLLVIINNLTADEIQDQLLYI